MHIRNKTAAAAITVVTAALAAGSTLGPLASSAGAASKTPLITVTMSKTAIKFSGGSTLPAGLIDFKVVSKSGDHALQLLRLHKGYTQQQAERDIGKSFQGDTKATRRIDTNITWLGGADAPAGTPGYFEEFLHAGHYMAVDQNGNAGAPFSVAGTPESTPAVDTTSIFTTRNNRWHVHTTNTLPNAGWIKFHNTALEPHFIVLSQVKKSTTKQEVRDYFASGSQKPPSFALRNGGNTNSGVVSPKHQIAYKYHLPSGRYLLMCFWTDVHTGKPHAYMGMWHIVDMA